MSAPRLMEGGWCKGKQVETAWPTKHAGPSHESHNLPPAVETILAVPPTTSRPCSKSICIRNSRTSPRPQLPVRGHSRRCNPSPRPLRSFQLASFALLLVLTIFSGSATARRTGAHGDRQLRSVVFANPAGLGHLLVDRSAPPLLSRMPLLAPRDTDDTDDTVDAEEPESTDSPTTTVAPSDTPEPTLIVDAPESSLTALPMPFDTSLGSNFTAQSCPDFFTSFLNNATFQSCLPFSLLLQNSISFFDASKSLVLITQTLDATCEVEYEQCSSLMGHYARELPKDTVCGDDLKLGNPTVTQALNGLIAYQPMYQAACTKDEGGNYCFANAVTNVSSATDSYIYYIPLGTNLPGGSRPTCNKCLRDTMAIFDSAAGNQTQPLSQTYVAAAGQINMGCGPNFVSAIVSEVNGAERSLGTGYLPLLALGVTLFSLLL